VKRECAKTLSSSQQPVSISNPQSAIRNPQFERPQVTINSAMTVDGKIDTFERLGAAISSAQDWERVDRLRAESDAVMVGGHTLLGDDPRLTVKSHLLRAERQARGLDENPAKVAVISKVEDPRLGPTLDEKSRFVSSGPARRVIFTTQQTETAQVERLRKLGVEVFVMGEERVDLVAALRCLREMGIKRLLVEGGSTLNAKLLAQRLVDEIYIYLAPLVFGGASAPTLAGGDGLKREEAIRLQLIGLEKMEDGAILLHYTLIR
jgi:2,5-diamino-6-(ribosylamino)-4(3H)-pyrimidinone 5'-phosphate reductase